MTTKQLQFDFMEPKKSPTVSPLHSALADKFGLEWVDHVEEAEESGEPIYTVLVYDCTFTLEDQDHNPKVDENGEIIIYNAPKLDYSYIAEYAEVSDLIPLSTVEKENSK